jgi:hypothetical protein
MSSYCFSLLALGEASEDKLGQFFNKDGKLLQELANQLDPSLQLETVCHS